MDSLFIPCAAMIARSLRILDVRWPVVGVVVVVAVVG